MRGYRVKVYPTKSQQELLVAMQWELSGAWNKLVGWRREHIDACCDWYERQGNERPLRPAEDATDEQKADYRKKAGAFRLAAVKRCMGKLGPPGYGWPKHTRGQSGKEASGYYYATVREVMSQTLLFEERPAPCSAQQYVALVKRFSKTKHPNPKGRGKGKRANEWRTMPLSEGSGVRIRWGDYGARGGKAGWYNCEVNLAGLWMRARDWDKGYAPKAESLVEGVSLVRESDGWYASVRVRRDPPELPAPIPGSIVGVNLGLRYLAAFSDGTLIENSRGERWSRELQKKQERKAEGKPCGESPERFSERGYRRVTWEIQNLVLKPLAKYETIVLHDTSRGASQGVATRIGKEHGGYVGAAYRTALAIKERFGERVREVSSVDLSRQCSHCGTKHATHYNRSIFSDGRRRETTRCSGCDERIQVDVNTARNAVGRYMESQEAAE